MTARTMCNIECPHPPYGHPTGMDALGKHDFSILLMLAGVHRVRTVATASDLRKSPCGRCRGATSPDVSLLLCRYSYRGEGV